MTGSMMGRMLIATSACGVCRLTLGETDESLFADLQAHFPDAAFQVGEADIQRIAGKVVAGMASGRWPEGIALDLRGTAFQRRVWAALRQIPAGQTLSYQQLAKKLGQPTAYRAVANACGANPGALLVPCHRVLRSNGDLGGFRWGIERKAALLKLESAPAPAALVG